MFVYISIYFCYCWVLECIEYYCDTQNNFPIWDEYILYAAKTVFALRSCIPNLITASKRNVRDPCVWAIKGLCPLHQNERTGFFFFQETHEPLIGNCKMLCQTSPNGYHLSLTPLKCLHELNKKKQKRSRASKSIQDTQWSHCSGLWL